MEWPQILWETQMSNLLKFSFIYTYYETPFIEDTSHACVNKHWMIQIPGYMVLPATAHAATATIAQATNTNASSYDRLLAPLPPPPPPDLHQPPAVQAIHPPQQPPTQVAVESSPRFVLEPYVASSNAEFSSGRINLPVEKETISGFQTQQAKQMTSVAKVFQLDFLHKNSKEIYEYQGSPKFGIYIRAVM